MTTFLNRFKLRWKLLWLVLPLVIIPICIVAALIGYIANHQAYLGVTQSSKDDLSHMVAFAVDLLDSHHQHYRDGVHNTAVSTAQERDSKAFAAIKEKIRSKKVGETGYIFCMDSNGTFTIHPERRGRIHRCRDVRRFSLYPRDVRKEERLDPLPLEKRRRARPRG